MAGICDIPLAHAFKRSKPQAQHGAIKCRMAGSKRHGTAHVETKNLSPKHSLQLLVDCLKSKALYGPRKSLARTNDIVLKQDIPQNAVPRENTQ